MTEKTYQERKMRAYIHYMMKAASCAPTKEIADELNKMLADTEYEHKVTISGGGPIIRVKVLGGRVAALYGVDNAPHGITQALSIGTDFLKACAQIKARGEKATVFFV